MTNLEGLWILFFLLFLLLACLGVTVFLLALYGWRRYRTRNSGLWLHRITISTAIGAIGLSILSWLAALVFITPSGIVERAFRPNPVLIVLLIGFTLPAIIGGYILREQHVPTQSVAVKE